MSTKPVYTERIYIERTTSPESHLLRLYINKEDHSLIEDFGFIDKLNGNLVHLHVDKRLDINNVIKHIQSFNDEVSS